MSDYEIHRAEQFEDARAATPDPLTEAQRELLHRTVSKALVAATVRVDDYTHRSVTNAAADAAADFFADFIADREKALRGSIAQEIEAIPCPGSPPQPLARYAFETAKEKAANIARGGAA